MKDLFVFTADSDAEAVLRAMLRRHKDLGIREISVGVRRFVGRDSGMVKDGPEIAWELVNKKEYRNLILIWDHHGSGWEQHTPELACDRIKQRLDSCTWTGRSDAVVAVPEIEEWIWCSRNSVAKHLGLNAAALAERLAQASRKSGNAPDQLMKSEPKELFESVLYSTLRRRPLPDDFAAITTHANVSSWGRSQSFSRLLNTLKRWFPSNQ